jgi:hypothetical protein
LLPASITRKQITVLSGTMQSVDTALTRPQNMLPPGTHQLHPESWLPSTVSTPSSATAHLRFSTLHFPSPTDPSTCPCLSPRPGKTSLFKLSQTLVLVSYQFTQWSCEPSSFILTQGLPKGNEAHSSTSFLFLI